MAASPFRLQRNARQRLDGLVMMRALEASSVAAVICDPQYRAVLDQLKFGNEGRSRQVWRAELPQMSDKIITGLVLESARVLRPSGYLFLWVDKFTLASAHHERWFDGTTKFATVDLISWDKLRLGMGSRTRCVTEYVMVYQRHPVRAGSTWSDRALPDCWREMADREVHPHAKPHRLTERLIRAVTKRGDLVVDPCAGGYGVLQACQDSGREFIGCDIEG